jgi:hypothetical protein
VEKLVREFLAAQSLTILPQSQFGDAVNQFVDKDDKHAMELFVEQSLKKQTEHMMANDAEDDNLEDMMGEYRSELERLFEQGLLKRAVSRHELAFQYRMLMILSTEKVHKVQTKTSRMGFRLGWRMGGTTGSNHFIRE